jgi:hypothetical protein
MKHLLPALLGVMLGFLSITSAHAQILLTINVSNPSATIIYASGTYTGSTLSSGSAGPFLNGIDLLQLFTSTVGSAGFTIASSSLSTGDGSAGPAFDSAFGDNYSFAQGYTLIDGADLNLFKFGDSTQMTFTNGDAAFSGNLTLDLSSASLPAPGTTGNIITGYNGGTPNVVVGEWVVAAPEPTTWALLLGGFGALAFLRRRLQQA